MKNKGASKASAFIRRDRRQHAHYVIDGEPFATINHVYAHAKNKGFTGTRAGLTERLKRGERTWAELAAPLKQIPNITLRKQRREAQRAEMHALCMELDKRKAQQHEDPLR